MSGGPPLLCEDPGSPLGGLLGSRGDRGAGVGREEGPTLQPGHALLAVATASGVGSWASCWCTCVHSACCGLPGLSQCNALSLPGSLMCRSSPGLGAPWARWRPSTGYCSQRTAGTQAGLIWKPKKQSKTHIYSNSSTKGVVVLYCSQVGVVQGRHPGRPSGEGIY